MLGATLQAAALFAVGVFVFVEGIRRLFEPPDIATTEVLIFGAVGLAANAVAVVILTRGGRSSNVNMRAAFLEVLNDAFGSVAVIVAAGIIALTGWQQADAVASLLIAVLIVPRTVKLLRETVSVLLESAPPGLDLDLVRRRLLQVPHVLAEDSCFQDGHAPQILDQLQATLTEDFDVSVEHSTFQLESPAHASHESAAHA